MIERFRLMPLQTPWGDVCADTVEQIANQIQQMRPQIFQHAEAVLAP